MRCATTNLSLYRRSALLLGLLLCAACTTPSGGRDPAGVGTGAVAPADAAATAPVRLLPVGAPVLAGLDNAAGFTVHCERKLATIHGAFSALAAGSGTENRIQLLLPLDELLLALSNLAGLSSLYSNVHPVLAMREAAEVCMQGVRRLNTEIGLSRPLYERLNRVSAEREDALTQRYLEKMLRGFKRSGVDQDQEKQEKIRVLRDEILKLGQEFARNIRSDVRRVQVLDPARLEGLPRDWLDAHPPGADGSISISTDYPDYFPVMQYAEDDALRLELYRQFRSRGHPANRAVLQQLLLKRHEMARLLGYPSYAAYDTEEKMIESPAEAQKFIDRINALATARARQEYQDLLQQLRRTMPRAQSVGDWQKSWLGNQIKRERFDIDPQEVRLYFRYARVRDGIFRLVQKLFAVEIRPWPTVSWHRDVESYSVHRGDKLLGYFYLDMHPRPNKYKHAAHFGIRTGASPWQLPVAALVCNFPAADHPQGGRMEHMQVETFLHEFGHLMHGILGGHQPWSTLSGIATEHDFVEAPSQMLEEWVWDHDTLGEFARDDEERLIPRELVQKMRAARDFGRGLWTRNQLFYAALSLHYYNRDPQLLHLDRDMVQLQKRYSPFEHVDGTAFYSSFGHLYGYAASYYTYMWSQVIAADMFREFEKAGLYNQQVAQRYRDQVLVPGGSADAALLVQNFLGRPFTFNAFIEQLNRGAAP